MPVLMIPRDVTNRPKFSRYRLEFENVDAVHVAPVPAAAAAHARAFPSQLHLAEQRAPALRLPLVASLSARLAY